jgi:hypothetical protein
MQHPRTESWQLFNTELDRATGGWFFVTDRYCDSAEAELYEHFIDADGHTSGAFTHGIFASPDIARAYLADLLGGYP